MKTEELLQEFIELLEQENRSLIESIKEKEISQQLLDIVEKKEKLLQKILSLHKEDVEPFKDKLRQIDEWSERNRSLAINNIEFVNDILDAIYSKDLPQKYTKEGKISTTKEGFFRKKA